MLIGQEPSHINQ